VPTPTQVANRRQVPPPVRFYTGTVTAPGPPVTVALDPGGASTKATPMVGTAYANGQRVLVLSTSIGNYVLGRIA